MKLPGSRPALIALLLPAMLAIRPVSAAAIADDAAGVAAAGLLTTENTLETRNDPHIYSVVLGPDGAFRGRIGTLTDTDGRINPAEGIAIQIVRAGEIVANLTTATDGTYSIEGLSPGVYSLIAGGKKTLTAFSFRAVEARDETPNGPRLETAGVSTRDIPLITDILGGAIFRQDEDAGITPGFLGTEGDTSYASGISVQTISMDSDGTVQGWVRSLEGDQRHIHRMSVQFIRDNRKIAETVVDQTGHFATSGLSPGTYSVVGVHPNGAKFAVAVEVLKPATTPLDEFIPAGVLQSEEFAIAIVLPRNLTQEGFEETTEDSAAESADSGPDQIAESTTSQPQVGAPPTGNPPIGGGAPGIGGGIGLIETVILSGGIWALIEANDDDSSPASGSN